MPAIPTVQNCCCFIPLRFACIIIGFLTATSCVPSIRYLIQELVSEEKDLEDFGFRYYELAWTIFFWSFVQTAIGIILIFSAIQRMTYWVKFISVYFASVAILQICFALAFILPQLDFTALIFYSLTVLIGFYFALVTWSCYNYLKHAEESRGVNGNEASDGVQEIPGER